LAKGRIAIFSLLAGTNQFTRCWPPPTTWFPGFT